MTAVNAAVLLGGIGLSAALVLVGLALIAATGTTGYAEPLSPQVLIRREAATPYPTTLGGVLTGVLAGKPFALIELGVLLLIATPVVRVGVSIPLFWQQRDYLYATISLGVLAVLLFGLFVVS
jgi:uncharacterized membrane protein